MKERINLGSNGSAEYSWLIPEPEEFRVVHVTTSQLWHLGQALVSELRSSVYLLLLESVGSPLGPISLWSQSHWLGPVPTRGGVGFRTRGPTLASQTVQGSLRLTRLARVYRHAPVLWVGPLWCLVSQSRLTVCNPMDCSPPGSSVHGILQASILGWIAMPSSRGSSQPRDQTQVSYMAGRFLYQPWGSLSPHLSPVFLKIRLRKALPSLLVLPPWQASPADLLMYFTSFCASRPLPH